MTLEAWTGRVFDLVPGLDPDRVDITRSAANRGDQRAAVFAPSSSILRPALLAFRRGGVDAERAWLSYKYEYIREMRDSYRRNREAWEQTLAQGRLVFQCFCERRERCHRGILVSEILVRLGARDMGEVVVVRGRGQREREGAR